MVSAKGGMDIEAVADEDPDALVKRHIDPTAGLRRRRGARRSPTTPGSTRTSLDQVAEVLAKLAEVARERGRDADRGQPADRHRRPRGRRARRQGDDRRQRALPPPGPAPSCATPAEDPQEAMAKEKGLTYVKLDGDIGILGNGAGLCMSTLDVVAQAGGAPGQLPRRRRRLQGRGDRRRARGDPLRREGHGRPLQHLRRHHPLRRGRQGHHRGLARRSTSTVPFVVRLDGTNSEEGRAILAEADLPERAPGEDDARRRRAGRRAGRGAPDGDHRRQRHEARRLRPHRPRGHLPRR